jgi:hypothetical protein
MNLTYPGFRLTEPAEPDGGTAEASGDTVVSSGPRRPEAQIADFTPSAEERSEARRQAARAPQRTQQPQSPSTLRFEVQLPRVDVIEVLRRFVSKSGFKVTASERAAALAIAERVAACNREIAEHTPDVVVARYKAVAADVAASPILETKEDALRIARDVRTKAKQRRDLAMTEAQPLIGPILERLHESVTEYANILGALSCQEADELGVSYEPAGAHAALLSCSAWLTEANRHPDFTLFARLFALDEK